MANKKEKILIFGYGKYGQFVAKDLRSKDYDVYIAEYNKKNIKRANNDGFNKVVLVDIENDNELLHILYSNGFKKIFCVLDNEEENVYLTITFKALMKDLEIISICESRKSERKLRLAGVNKVIDIIELAANRLFFVLEKPAVTYALDEIFFKDSNIVFEEIVIPKNSFLDGVNIDDIDFRKYKIIVIGIVDRELENRFTFITRGIKYKLDAKDILIVTGKKDDIKIFKTKLNESTKWR